MLIPPPTLTPMERQLLSRLQDLEQAQKERAAAQDDQIATFQTEMRSRDRSIAALTGLLERLLGPMALE